MEVRAKGDFLKTLMCCMTIFSCLSLQDSMNELEMVILF